MWLVVLSAVLSILARASSSQQGDSPSYVQQAEHILEQLSSPKSDVKPNEFTYATYVRSNVLSRDGLVRLICYIICSNSCFFITPSSVLTVYMRSGDPDAASRADALVRRMEDLYEQGKLASPPDQYHYTTLFNTYARSPDRVQAAHRVLELLVHMWDTSIHKNRPSCRPNTRTYNSVLDCLIRAGELERAEELLYHVLGLYRQGVTQAAPDLYSFNRYVIVLVLLCHCP